VEKELVTLHYGTNQPPTRGGSPTGLVSKQDEKRIDEQKAEYAQTGGKHGEKPPFYATAEGDPEAIVEVCQENVNDWIRSQN